LSADLKSIHLTDVALARTVRSLPLVLLLLVASFRPVLAQWKVGRVDIVGNERVTGGQLLSIMTLSRGKSYAEWQAEEDRARILAFYRSRGFLQAEVQEFEKNINIEKQVVDITIRIDEGRQTMLAKIAVAGNTVFTTGDLLGMVDVAEGRPLDARKLGQLKQRIANRYHDAGYLNARVEDHYYFPASEREAEVYFDIAEGPRVNVGEIEVTGNEKIKTYIITKALEISPGGVYTEEKMRRSKANLFRIGVLRDIRHELHFHEQDSSVVDVRISVSEGEFRAVGAGGGIGDVDGLRGWLELGNYNLFQRAFGLIQLTRVTYQPFEKNPTYEYSYSSSLTLRQPYFLNSRIEASTTGLFEKVSYANHDEEKLGINLLLRNMITERRELSLLLELNQRNIFNVDTLSADQSIVDNRGNNITNLITPLVMFDQRDDRFNPERGYMVVLRSTLAGGPFLFGSINFYRFSFEGSYLQPLYRLPGGSPIILAGQIKLGKVREFESTPSVPPTEAFNIGGGKSLRGYGELSVGPINDRNVAGNILIQSNFELRFPVWHSLGGVLFLDAANVFSQLHLDQRFHLLTTAGAGLRYRTPVGPLRIDAAWKLNNFSADVVREAGEVIDRERASWGRIHFGIGHSF